MPIVLSPSILQIEDLVADSPELLQGVARALKEGGADSLHADVMDQETVQDSRFETPGKARNLIDACRKTGLALDAHLMVKDVPRYAAMYGGAELITFHPEYAGYRNTLHLISEIRRAGALLGVAMNPDDSIDGRVEIQYLSKADLLLFMTVQAGRGGQSFDLYGPKVLDAMHKCPTYAAQFQIDGGIKPDISMLRQCIEAGANNLVIGSGITYRCNGLFREGKIGAGLVALKEDVSGARAAIQTAKTYGGQILNT